MLVGIAVLAAGTAAFVSASPANASLPRTLTAIDCATPSWCVAGGGKGAVYAFDGKHWTQVDAQLPSDGVVLAVSCTSRSFCMLDWNDRNDHGGTSVYRGHGWTALSRFGSAEQGGLSCTSEQFCMQVLTDDPDGTSGAQRYRTWNGSTWSSMHAPAVWHLRNNVSVELQAPQCFSPTRCAVAEDYQRLDYWNGSTWTSTTLGSGRLFPSAVACPGRHACLAVGSLAPTSAQHFVGHSWLRRHGRWTSTPISTRHEWMRISCSGGHFCLAIGGAGATKVWTGSHWTSADRIPADRVVSVSCPTAFSCRAVTAEGAIFHRDGHGHWHAGTTVGR